MTAQSVEKDGQKQTERQTDRQTEWGRGEKMTYINKTAIITMERLQRGMTAKVGAALQGGRVTQRGAQPIRECARSPREDGREVEGRKPNAPDTWTNTGADGGCGMLL